MREYFRTTEMQLFGKQSDSVPLKKLPWDTKALIPANSSVQAITSREATALIIAAKAMGAQRIVGGMTIFRRFRLGGAQWVIENGCGQDIVHSKTAGWLPAEDPLEDAFVLTNIFVEGFLSPGTLPRLPAFLSANRPSQLNG